MTQQTLVRNPFMLLLHPEVVLAAIEKSERLERLNRHLCRPLDQPAPVAGRNATHDDADDEPEAPLAR